MKFSVGKDGRATLSVGWSDFAMSNGIRPGSVLAFVFSSNESALDLEIDVLIR